MASKADLYTQGIKLCTKFLVHNRLPLPKFYTYVEAEQLHTTDLRMYTFFKCATAEARLVGRGTGLYFRNHVFTNLPKCAAPVRVPRMRSWSWPGWKTDRTPMGVVAHEVGHHVEVMLHGQSKAMYPASHTPKWRGLLKVHKKRVSSYEPIPAEAWAETMRLFILNPDLLRRALPWRYNFVTGQGLMPLPELLHKGWEDTLDNPNYTGPALKFMEVSNGPRLLD